MDTKAIQYVLMNSHIYQKPESVRYNLGRIVGEGTSVLLEIILKCSFSVIAGVLVVEGDKHRQQVYQAVMIVTSIFDRNE